MCNSAGRREEGRVGVRESARSMLPLRISAVQNWVKGMYEGIKILVNK